MSGLTQNLSEAWKRLLAFYGIGATEIYLDVPGGQYPRGSSVSGIVTVCGGQVTQELVRLTLFLRTLKRGEYSATHVLVAEDLARNLMVVPHTTYEFPFTLRIPDDARLACFTRGQQTDGCVLAADGDPKGNSMLRQASVPLNVTIHREVEAILDALRMMGFEEETWFSQNLLRPDASEETTAVFRAPERLQEQIETLSVFLSVTDHQVIGKVHIILRAQSGDRAAMSDGNRRDCPLSIPCSELWLADSVPDPQGAIPYLKRILSLALALPDEPQSWMLRPSTSPPTDPDTLLRPTMPTTSAASDNLLRPTTPPKETP